MKSILTILFIAVFFGCSHSPTGNDGLTPELPVYSFPAYNYTCRYTVVTMDSTVYDLCEQVSSGGKERYIFTVSCTWQGEWIAFVKSTGVCLHISEKTQVKTIRAMQKINYELFRDFPGQMHFIDSTLFW